jgi:hypothetical protein
MKPVDITTVSGYRDLNICPEYGDSNPDCENCHVVGCARGESLIRERKKKGCNTCGLDRRKNECQEIPCIGCPQWRSI